MDIYFYLTVSLHRIWLRRKTPWLGKGIFKGWLLQKPVLRLHCHLTGGPVQCQVPRPHKQDHTPSGQGRQALWLFPSALLASSPGPQPTPSPNRHFLLCQEKPGCKTACWILPFHAQAALLLTSLLISEKRLGLSSNNLSRIRGFCWHLFHLLIRSLPPLTPHPCGWIQGPSRPVQGPSPPPSCRKVSNLLSNGALCTSAHQIRGPHTSAPCGPVLSLHCPQGVTPPARAQPMATHPGVTRMAQTSAPLNLPSRPSPNSPSDKALSESGIEVLWFLAIQALSSVPFRAIHKCWSKLALTELNNRFPEAGGPLDQGNLVSP